MIKTRFNGNLWKYLIYAATILVEVGVYMTVIESNCKRIEKVEARSEKNEKDIIGMQKDISYIKEGIDDIKAELKGR